MSKSSNIFSWGSKLWTHDLNIESLCRSTMPTTAASAASAAELSSGGPTNFPSHPTSFASQVCSWFIIPKYDGHLTMQVFIPKPGPDSTWVLKWEGEGCVAQRNHFCFPPSSVGFESRNCRDFSLYSLVCGQYWDRTYLVTSIGFHKCS